MCAGMVIFFPHQKMSPLNFRGKRKKEREKIFEKDLIKNMLYKEKKKQSIIVLERREDKFFLVCVCVF